MMEGWLVLGLLAAVSYGLAGLAAKVALGDEYAGLTVTAASILTAIGVGLVFTVFYFRQEGFSLPGISLKSAFAGMSIGLFWALGQIFVYTAVLKGADISRMAPIYNMNTLIVVVLAIVFLGEVPDKSAVLRVVSGAVFIVLGGILVST